MDLLGISPRAAVLRPTGAMLGIASRPNPPLPVLSSWFCIFAFHVILALVSIVWAPKRSEDNDDSPMSPDESALKSPEFRLPPTPGTTGGIKSPTTPRTLAFNKLGGTKDLPLRNHFSSPTPKSPTYNNYGGESSSQEPMYFPPPPKAPIK